MNDFELTVSDLYLLWNRYLRDRILYHLCEVL